MKQLFINLPVKDPTASRAFYEGWGFTVNPLFSFDNQQCMVWNDQVYLMLQNAELSRKGSVKKIADSREYRIASFTLPVDSPEQLQEMAEQALQAGGKETANPIDENFMQVRTIEDPDGHTWGILYLDLEKFKAMTGK